MPQNLANELNSLDFGTLIGGPLQAAVNAQNDAALAQVNYIKAVGFKTVKDSNDQDIDVLNMVNFHYQEGTGADATHYTFSMPLLSMLNIPALRIDEMTIDFNAKLTSVETASTDTSAAASAELGLSYGKIASLKASASYQKTTSTGSKVDKTYSMSIHVRVVNDEIPIGLERMLTVMENRIIEAPHYNPDDDNPDDNNPDDNNLNN